MALIAVLWLVTAMGLIITGIVKSVRSEVRIAGFQRQALIANGLADAAILLALQNLHAQQMELRNTIQVIPVQFEGLTSQVEVQPLNGLIDINNATPLLLANMYRYAGGLNPNAAQTLAQATVESRQLKNAKGVAQGFDAIEDLLRVPAMNYTLYAKIAGLVTAEVGESSGRVNPMSAPQEVIQVLTDGDTSRATVLVAKRNVDPNAMDTSFLKPDFIQMASSRSLRLKVSVALPEGGHFQKIWHVYWGADPRSELPWRLLSTQQSSQPSAPFEH